MSKQTDKITKDISTEISEFNVDNLDSSEIGKVLEVKDGIAVVDGLSKVQSQEKLQFESGVEGIALNLEEDVVGVIILGEFKHVKEGELVKRTGEIISVPVGEEMVGRVINSLGEAIDGGKDLNVKESMPIEKVAPGVMTRTPVDTPLQTGIKAIDALIPIGRGQRELILGDRQTGKSAIAIDTILNQKGEDVICIYIAIGQKESKVARTVSKLKEAGAMEYTTVVLASASDPAPMLYLAPYTGVYFSGILCC